MNDRGSSEGGSYGRPINYGVAARSFYSATVPHFLSADPHAIVGQLASRHVAVHAAAEAEQLRAWERQIELLKVALSALGPAADGLD